MSEIQIPQGWHMVTLQNIAKPEKYSIKRGPWGSSIKKDFFVTEGYKVYQQYNIIYNDFEYGNYFLNEENFKGLSDFEVKPGDFLISCSGTIGKAAVVPANAKPGLMNQALLKISVDENKILPHYFLYLLQSELIKNQILTKGSAMKNVVAVNELKTIQLPLPDKTVQRKIVQKLDYIFAQLEEKKKAIKSYNNFEKLQNPESFLIQIALDGLISGKLTQNWREKNDMKKEWGKKSLGNLTIDSKNGKTGRPKDEPPGIPRLGITSITHQVSGSVNEKECKFVEVLHSELEKYSVISGDVMVCRQNGNKEFVGKCAVYRGNTRPLIFSDSLIRFRVDTREILPEFFVIFASSTEGRTEIEQFCTTTAGNYSINASNLKQIQVGLPTLREQEEIIRLKDEIIKKVDNVKKEIKKFLTMKEKTLSNLESIQNSVLNAAFSGKLVN